MTEIEYDMYTTLANVYDTQDLTVNYDWRQQYNDKMPSSNAQRIGAIAETRFIAECLERDFEPHTPTTPMPWDFIVTCPAGDLKVQIKSTSVKAGTFYTVNAGSGTTQKLHISNDVDVVGVYVSPIKMWWMIPRGLIESKTIKLSPEQASRSKYKKYQENWSIYYE